MNHDDDMAGLSRPLFYRSFRSTTSLWPRAPYSVFEYVPLDVWILIFDIYVADAFQERPTLGNSFIVPLANWTPPPSRTSPPRCVPRDCCLTMRGARTAQTQKCSFTGHYDRRGLSALLHVDGYARQRLLSYHGYLGYYRFDDPASIHNEFPDRASVVFSPTGLCLCALDRANELLSNAVKAVLTFPSSNASYTRSPSRIIAETLLTHGVRRLEHLDVRFDWNNVFDEDRRKLLLVAKPIRRMIAVNSIFLVHGPLLQVLRIAAEEDFFSWKSSDIYSVLRACPLLTDLELVTVLAPDPRKSASGAEEPIHLNRLVHLRLCDSLKHWSAIRQVLVTPVLARVEVDIISSHMGVDTKNLDDWWDETVEIARFASQSCPRSLLSARRLALNVHFQRDMDERYEERYKTKLWPEYMQLSLARSAEVLLDPDAHPSEPYFIFTERSTTTSTKAYASPARARKTPRRSPKWIYDIFWGCALNSLDAASEIGLLGRVRDVVVSTDDHLPSPNNWQTILLALPAVRRLYAPGIRRIGHGLIHLILALGIRDGRDIPGGLLQEIHLPDWDWSIEPIPVNLIKEITYPERRFLTAKATWH